MTKLLQYICILSFILTFNTHLLNAQDFGTIDSLKQATHTEKDKKVIVDNYIDIADEFGHNYIDSAELYVDKALALANQISYTKGLAKAYFLESYYYDLLGRYNRSIASMERAIELFTQIPDSSYLSGCYNNLGVLYSYGENQKKSLDYFIKSIHIGEALQDSFSLAEAFSNVAGFYETSNEYTSALNCLLKALEVDRHYNKPENIAISLLDVGYINTKLLRYDDAIKNLKEAQGIMQNIEDPYYRILLNQRLALYHKETNALTTAEDYIRKALQLGNNFDFPMLKVESQSIKGEILLKQKKYNESLGVLDSAISFYETTSSAEMLQELYSHKANALSGLNRHNQAYSFLLKADQARKSARSYETAELLGEFEKNAALKEERERLSLQQELEDQKDENALIRVRSRLYFTIILASVLGAVLLVALYLFLLKQRHNKSLAANYELINHHKQLLEKRNAELKERENKLAQLNATKDKFFSIIAHDLKNPFNTLIGISELMMSNPGIKHTEDFEELIQGMFQTAQSGHDLLENLLEWSRSQVGNIQLQPKLISLDQIFASATTLFQETAKAKNISITFPENIREVVYADYNMVDFIFRNLLNNAIKFSYPGSNIEVTTQAGNNDLEICVKDHGIGMDQDTVDKLFKLEHSIQKNGTANEKGTGLGLLLCKEFVEKNRGKIWVESREGAGSKFCFCLPRSEKE